jgi:hypothetical protein
MRATKGPQSPCGLDLPGTSQLGRQLNRKHKKIKTWILIFLNISPSGLNDKAKQRIISDKYVTQKTDFIEIGK